MGLFLSHEYSLQRDMRGKICIPFAACREAGNSLVSGIQN